MEPETTGRCIDYGIAECGTFGTTTGPCDAFSSDTLGYDMSGQGPVYTIPVVWHILHDGATGNIPDSLIQTQMTLLNEGFNAKPGSYAENSASARIEFVLADSLPIERIDNAAWFDSLTLDLCSTFDSLVVASLTRDTSRYLNLITHGYGTGLGSNHSWYPWAAATAPFFDAAELFHANIGKLDAGRIAVHEVGHWLGLYHVEEWLNRPDCSGDCYTGGDLLCDTDHFPTCSTSTACPLEPIDSTLVFCGHVFQDPNNFLKAQRPPSCFTEFTREQSGRMRCGLETYRPQAYLGIVESSIAAPDTVSAFCYRGNSLIQFTVPWGTNIATTDTDTLEIFFPAVSCGSFVSARATASPNGTSHSVTYQGPCTPGTYKYNIRSRKGILGTRSMCRTFVVTSCPSCPQCEDPPCELE